jgi:hypothetical protein
LHEIAERELRKKQNSLEDEIYKFNNEYQRFELTINENKTLLNDLNELKIN